MPIESRYFIKAGLAWLLLAFLAGATLLVSKALGYHLAGTFAIQHAHFAGVGWLVNMVIGVAFWMFPLDRERFPSTRGRYPRAASHAIFGLLNGGLILRTTIEPVFDLGHTSPLVAGLLAIAAIAQVGAIGLFVLVIWSRVRGPARPSPE